MNSFPLFQALIRPVLIGLMLLYWEAPKASAADYVVALDVSGSMNWSLFGKKAQITPLNPVRIEVARKYLLDYLDSLPDDAHVDLIAFRERMVSEKEVTLKDAATREDAQKWVAGLHPTSDGHTHLWQTFDEVLQRATAYCAAFPGSWVNVRVLTDGENNDPTNPTLGGVLDKFRNVDGKAMKPDLVLLLPQDSKLIQQLKKQAGDRVNVTNSASGAAFPPVIKWAPDPITAKTSISFLTIRNRPSRPTNGKWTERRFPIRRPSITSSRRRVATRFAWPWYEAMKRGTRSHDPFAFQRRTPWPILWRLSTQKRGNVT